MSTSLRLTCLGVLCAAALAGCGGDDSTVASTNPAGTVETLPASPQVPAGAAKTRLEHAGYAVTRVLPNEPPIADSAFQTVSAGQVMAVYVYRYPSYATKASRQYGPMLQQRPEEISVKVQGKTLYMASPVNESTPVDAKAFRRFIAAAQGKEAAPR